MRGSVARTHRYKVATIIVFMISHRLGEIVDLPIKKIEVSSLIIKIFAYSAIKIIANNPLLYSILNPDTNSDSPSAKSNGVRFVSARFVIYHIRIRGIHMIEIHEYKWEVIMCRSIVYIIISAVIKIRAIDTSYEIVWATLRKAPNRAYFELAHHPEINVTYTFILDTHKKYRAPKVRNVLLLM